MAAVISLLVIISLSLLTTRIGALALVHTGLSLEVAKFQARSAYMGVGFTTGESEMIMSNPVRRKVLTILMFLGNAGIITTISSVIFSFISIEDSGIISAEVLVLISGLTVLYFLAQSDWVDQRLSKIIDRALSKYTYLDVKDYYSLLHLSENYRVTEVRVEEKNWMKNKRLDQLDLSAEGIMVLGIRRENGNYVGAPVGKTVVKEGDILILYGRVKLLRSLERRESGNRGDAEHRDAVSEQEEIQKNQEE